MPALDRRKRWTADEYYRMADLGLFSQGRVELVEGDILEMSPQNHPHIVAIVMGTTELTRVFAETHAVQVQAQLDLSDTSAPEPDFALFPVAELLQARRAATRADLVIEISDSSLKYDRDQKSAIYARANIPEMWIMNLQSPQVEVLRDPGPLAESELGYGYRSRTVLPPRGTLSPLFAPDKAVSLEPFFRGLGDPALP